MKKRRTKKWTDEQLKDAVAQSTNLTDVLRVLGLRVAGGNHKSVKYWIEEFKLDTTHFSNEKQLSALKKSRRILDIKNVLCEHSMASKSTVKRWARKFLEYVCKECRCGPKHNNKPLVLQLDHINGVADDNRIGNLRWLCPNCHSQTDTFAGRKK